MSRDGAEAPLTDIGEYRIVRPLGAGAMGQVWLARDTLLDRLVAVKVIGAAHPSRQLRERFFVEARALARLQHPNVVTLHRVGEVDGRPFLVSELLQGRSLQALEKPVPWRKALELGLGLARGLSAAHRQGVLHRDIKPGNAWLTEDGTPKLLDFGLAKLRGDAEDAAPPSPPAPALPALVRPAHGAPAPGPDATLDSPAAPLPADPPASPGTPADAALTRHGAILGSPLYMPPEAWRGEPASPRGDVYSLGAVLFELCTGYAPLSAFSLEELPRAAQQEDAPRLAHCAPDVDPTFAALVDRCLARDPTRRFDTADELREALERLSLPAFSGALPEGPPYRGLLAFEAEHRGFFFGRDADILAVVERLRSERCVLVTAGSGVGKSSLCRAGILPALAAGAFGPRRVTAALVPGPRPLAALAAALAPLLEEDERELWVALKEEPASVGRRLRQRHRSGVVLFVDQLEELVTLAVPGEAEQVASALSALALEAHGVQLLGAVRSDAYVQIAALPGLGDFAARGMHVLRPLSTGALREAITGPARARGFAFESEDMVETLIAAGGAGEGALPLLQFALAQLWEMRDAGRRQLTAASLASMGGVEGCLARHGDGVLAALPSAQREAARRLLLRLVTPEGRRAQRLEHELLDEDPASRPALEALVRGRLVVSRGVGETAEPTWSLAHEALIDHWDRLREWLEGSAERRAHQGRLERAAREWERLGRPGDSLLGARQLEEARLLPADSLRAPERALLAASARALRTRRVVRGALPALVLLAALPFLKVRYDRSRALAVYEGELATLSASAREQAGLADRARTEAFARFDAGALEQGEQSWEAARSAAQAAQALFTQAGGVAERALSLQPDSKALQSARAELLASRLGLAERMQAFDEAKAMEARLAAVDPGGAVLARVTAPATLSLRSSPPGARVRLVPVQTHGPRAAAARTPLEVRTPWEGALGHGGWLATFDHDGYLETRAPVLLAAGEPLALDVPLLPAAKVPEGFLHVPAGTFLQGSSDDEGLRRFFLNAQPLHAVRTEAFLIARHEVTFGEWLAFLASLPEAEREARRPATLTRFNGVQLDHLPGRGWQLTLKPSNQRYVALQGEPLVIPGRRVRTMQDWSRLPVTAITFEDALAFTAWLDRTGRVPGARPCTEHEWERAARGADARHFPSGDALGPEDANHDVTYGREPTAFGPDEVGSHPGSRSPFGVDDASGNVWEMTRSMRSGATPVLRGGSWYQGTLSAQLANREESEAHNRDPLVGFRVCANPPPP